MAASIGEIIAEMKEFISRHDENYANWYIGITNDPITRLLEDHKVDIDKDRWLCSEAINENVARMIEKRFVEEFGASGDCDDSESGSFVYAYRMSDNTKP